MKKQLTHRISPIWGIFSHHVLRVSLELPGSPPLFSGIQGQDHQRHRPSSERLEWTHWFHQQGPLKEPFSGGKLPIFLGVFKFSPFGPFVLNVDKYIDFVEFKRGFGGKCVWIWVVRGGDDVWFHFWYQARLRCGRLEVCHHARFSAIFSDFPLERIWPLRKRVSTPPRTLWVIASTRSGYKLWGTFVRKVWERERMPTDFGVWKQFLP